MSTKGTSSVSRLWGNTRVKWTSSSNRSRSVPRLGLIRRPVTGPSLYARFTSSFWTTIGLTTTTGWSFEQGLHLIADRSQRPVLYLDQAAAGHHVDAIVAQRHLELGVLARRIGSSGRDAAKFPSLMASRRPPVDSRRLATKIIVPRPHPGSELQSDEELILLRNCHGTPLAPRPSDRYRGQERFDLATAELPAAAPRVAFLLRRWLDLPGIVCYTLSGDVNMSRRL